MDTRIALITEELPHLGQSGGIGAAFFELAVALRSIAKVDLIYVSPSIIEEHDEKAARQALAHQGLALRVVNISNSFGTRIHLKIVLMLLRSTSSPIL